MILVAEADGQLLGFCQLYPTWCSVAAARIFVLYDLFVDAGVRRGGVGRALMLAAQAFGREAGAVRLDLSTARTNTRAQALYESLGWQRDDVYLHLQPVARGRLSDRPRTRAPGAAATFVHACRPALSEVPHDARHLDHLLPRLLGDQPVARPRRDRRDERGAEPGLPARLLHGARAWCWASGRR